jgi:pimeloyl-ACP methyl ester carboxylesterase
VSRREPAAPQRASYGEADMESFEIQERMIHGHAVGYRTAGSGPVLVLIHGMAGSSNTWRHVFETLAQRFTVVAPDLPGHGRSDKPRGDYSLGALASNVRDLLVALGHERATVVGQSLGGGVAMQFAYQFPERCERLVLVSSGGLGADVSVLLRLLTLPGTEYVLAAGCHRSVHDAGARLSGWLAKLGVRPGARLEEMWTSYGSLAEGETRTAFLQTLRSVVDFNGQRVSAHDRLYLAAAVPTLIVWGDRDDIIPVTQAYMTHEAITGSRLEIFEGVSHFPHAERPERFVEVLIDFLDTTDAAALSPEVWRERVQAGSAG